jgi:hypothetical protein
MGYEAEARSPQVVGVARPVLFGKMAKLKKAFDVDAWQESRRTVVEVEAGQAVTNYRFLKDFFEACAMQDVDHLVIALADAYAPQSKRDNPQRDYDTVVRFFQSLLSQKESFCP